MSSLPLFIISPTCLPNSPSGFLSCAAITCMSIITFYRKDKGNELINQWTINSLELKLHDTVLEIGMGNGYFVKEILKTYASIHYTGIDYSQVMVDAARGYNHQLIEKRQANFIFGDAGSLPYSNDSFSKIFTINTIYFWGEAGKELKEIRRVLKPEGKLVMAVRSKETMQQMPFTEFGFVKYNAEELSALLEKNDFNILEIIQKKEPAFTFNDQLIELENIIISCTK